MNQASGHITDAQIQDYVTASRTSPEAHKWLDAHLEDCESCLGRLLQAERIHLGLLEGDAMKGTPYPGCPAEETLQELAAGICAPDTAERTVQHAAHCDYCGPLLGLYLKELSDDAQSEDAALLSQLETATPKWQKSFIREHLVKEAPRTGSTFSLVWSGLWSGFWPRLATATAGIAVAVGGYFLLIPPDDLSQAQKLVAAAYGERRTTEMRFPSAPSSTFLPTRVERSGDSGVDWTSEPEPLLQAEAILNKKRKSGDLSPQWIEIQGRINLLEAQPTSVRKAAEAFEEAQRKDPGNINLKIDLAAAYFEREMKAASDHPVLTRTIDLLNQVVKNSAANDQQKSAALFDLAVAYEKSNKLDLARDTWEQYLRVDPSGSWADEARARLQKTKERIPDPKLQGYVNSKDPSFFLGNSSSPVVEQTLEEYQEVALTSWLPQALEHPESEPAQAILRLADLMEQQHSDLWLRDLLRSTQPRDLRAAQSLATAIEANKRGLYNKAIAESKIASAGFGRTRDAPAELRARFEEIYALRSMLLGSACLQPALALQRRLSGSTYRWLQAQLLLEQSQCSNFMGEHARADRDSIASLKMAERYRFPILVLRVMGIDASIKHQQKRCDEGLKESTSGAGLYWAGIYPVERLDQFYAVMWQCALESGDSYAAEALLRRTVEMRESLDKGIPKNEIREATLELHLKNILSARGETTLAEAEKEKALARLENAGESYAQNFRLSTELDPAERLLQQHDAELALSTLKPIEQMLKTTQDSFFALRFYRLLGNIYTKLRKPDEASNAFELAIRMAEDSLSGLKGSQERLGWIRATGDSYRGLVRVLLQQDRQQEALARWEWYKSRPELLDSVDPAFDAAARASVEQSQRQTFNFFLPHSSETRLIYASFEDGLQIWVYRAGKVHSRWIEMIGPKLRQAAEEFIRQCSTPTTNLEDLRQRGRGLYTALLQPVAQELSEQDMLVVELDNPISDLPLGALMMPSGHYVEDKYSIIYSPGIWVEHKLRSSEPIQTGDPILLVDASHSPDGENLPGATLERKTISNLFPHATVVDAENTSWSALRLRLATSEIFVFIGHGKPDGDGTVLVLNSKEILGAKDFSQILLSHAKLAVLSACSSGRGKDDGPLDTDNLVHSFLSAGVPMVVASHWNVDSAMTGRLMANFYMHLHEEKSVAQAMTHARREILRDMPHPYYWAAFSLVGRAS